MKRRKKGLWRRARRAAVLAVVCLVLLGGLLAVSQKRADIREAWNKRNAPAAVLSEAFPVLGHLPEIPPAVARVLEASPIPEPLPRAFDLAVPFTPQAPDAVWDATHEEACEEASLYMVHAFYQGVAEGRITPKIAEAEIQKVIAYEMKTFGFFEDTDADQTARIARELYGYEKTVVMVDPSIDDIKRQIVAGRPVLVPAAGQLLNNPFYNPPGPVYHMLVIRGFTKTDFITNDSGTRRGEGYQYPFEIVMNAMHDWNNGDVLNGRKAAFVIYQNP